MPLVIVAFNVDAMTKLWIVRKIADVVHGVMRAIRRFFVALQRSLQVLFSILFKMIWWLVQFARYKWRTLRRCCQRIFLHGPQHHPDIENTKMESTRVYLEKEKKETHKNEEEVRKVRKNAAGQLI